MAEKASGDFLSNLFISSNGSISSPFKLLVVTKLLLDFKNLVQKRIKTDETNIGL